jgi:hypothetical protein
MWFNPHITISDESVFYEKWYKKYINAIKHIMGEGNAFLPDADLRKKYSITFNFLEYLRLRSAISPSWKRALKDRTVRHNPFPIDYKSLSCKTIYWELTEVPTEIFQRTKWMDVFNFDETIWEDIWSLSFKCTFETKLQAFQFSVLYRFVPYKEKLYLLDLVESPICDYCTESDSIIHRFVGCQQIRVFWSDFVRWWETATGLSLNLTAEIILLGNYKSTSYSQNSCILLAKYFIHLQKYKLLPVTLSW